MRRAQGTKDRQEAQTRHFSVVDIENCTRRPVGATKATGASVFIAKPVPQFVAGVCG